MLYVCVCVCVCARARVLVHVHTHTHTRTVCTCTNARARAHTERLHRPADKINCERSYYNIYSTNISYYNRHPISTTSTNTGYIGLRTRTSQPEPSKPQTPKQYRLHQPPDYTNVEDNEKIREKLMPFRKEELATFRKEELATFRSELARHNNNGHTCPLLDNNGHTSAPVSTFTTGVVGGAAAVLSQSSHFPPTPRYLSFAIAKEEGMGGGGRGGGGGGGGGGDVRGGVDKRGWREVSPLVLRYQEVIQQVQYKNITTSPDKNITTSQPEVIHLQTSAEQGLKGDTQAGVAAGGGGVGGGGGMKVGRLKKSQTLDTWQSEESSVTRAQPPGCSWASPSRGSEPALLALASEESSVTRALLDTNTNTSTKINSSAGLHDVLIGHVPTLEQVCRSSSCCSSRSEYMLLNHTLCVAKYICVVFVCSKVFVSSKASSTPK